MSSYISANAQAIRAQAVVILEQMVAERDNAINAVYQKKIDECAKWPAFYPSLYVTTPIMLVLVVVAYFVDHSFFTFGLFVLGLNWLCFMLYLHEVKQVTTPEKALERINTTWQELGSLWRAEETHKAEIVTLEQLCLLCDRSSDGQVMLSGSDVKVLRFSPSTPLATSEEEWARVRAEEELRNSFPVRVDITS